VIDFPALGVVSKGVVQQFALQSVGIQGLPAEMTTAVENKRFQGGFNGGANELSSSKLATMDNCLINCLGDPACAAGAVIWRLAKDVAFPDLCCCRTGFSL
jgi:hypothetical protein